MCKIFKRVLNMWTVNYWNFHNSVKHVGCELLRNNDLKTNWFT